MYWVQTFLVSLSVAEYFFKTIALTASNYVSLGWLQLQSSFPRHPVCLFFSHFHAVFFCVFVPLDFQSWLQSPHAFSLNTSSLNVSLSWRITRSCGSSVLAVVLPGWEDQTNNGEQTWQLTACTRFLPLTHKQTERFKHKTSITSHAF